MRTWARPWAIPGTPELMHRLGGLEKQDGTGNVSYDPENHQHMVETRAAKVARVAEFIKPLEVHGADSGTLLISWGGTYGACHTAVERCLAEGQAVGARSLSLAQSVPQQSGDILARYERVVVAELNTGQLRSLLKQQFLVDAEGLNKVKGKPFDVGEIVAALSSTSTGS